MGPCRESSLNQNTFNKEKFTKIVRFQVLVEFNQDFIEIQNNIIKIGIKSRPIKGQANTEMVKKIAKHFGISTNNITILSGFKSKIKNIEINI